MTPEEAAKRRRKACDKLRFNCTRLIAKLVQRNSRFWDCELERWTLPEGGVWVAVVQQAYFDAISPLRLGGSDRDLMARQEDGWEFFWDDRADIIGTAIGVSAPVLREWFRKMIQQFPCAAFLEGDPLWGRRIWPTNQRR